jgi:hypothetical protein
MRVARYEVPGKVRKSGLSRRRRLIRSFPRGLPAPGRVLRAMFSSGFSMELAAKLKALAAPLMMFVSSCRLSERGT